MDEKVRKNIGALAVLLIVGAFFYVTWKLFGVFAASITTARSEVAAAIIGAMATVFAGISAILISQTYERKRAAEEAHRLKKVEIYQEFINMISRMIGSSNEHLSLKEPDLPELVKYLFKFKADILLWGSPRVIKAQIEFENASGKSDTPRLFKKVNELYLAIREDIGLSNSGLSNLELVKLYLKEDARTQLNR